MVVFLGRRQLEQGLCRGNRLSRCSRAAVAAAAWSGNGDVPATAIGSSPVARGVASHSRLPPFSRLFCDPIFVQSCCFWLMQMSCD